METTAQTTFPEIFSGKKLELDIPTISPVPLETLQALIIAHYMADKDTSGNPLNALDLQPQTVTVQRPTREILETLSRCAMTLATFRSQLAKAGYPFREPPRVAELIASIDAIVYPNASDIK